MPRNILDTLKAEHDVLRGLFQQVGQTTDRAEKTRAELLEKIEANLVPHAKWEEKVFYPAFKERADRDGRKTHAEALLEHAAVEDAVLPSVKGTDVSTPEFAGRAKVLAELVDHHAKEEETTLFSMARELFSAEELVQFDRDYEQWKQSPTGLGAVAGAKLKTGVQAATRKVTGQL